MPSPTAETGRKDLSVLYEGLAEVEARPVGWEVRSVAEVVGGAAAVAEADLDAHTAAARTALSRTVVKIDVASAWRI